MRTRRGVVASRRERLLVIGGLAAGMSAASAAKRIRPQMDVIVLEKSPFISYGTCSIPYYISEEIKGLHTASIHLQRRFMLK